MGFAEFVVSASPEDFGEMLLLAAAAALVGTFLSFVYLRRTRLIEDTPTSRIRSAAQGYVEFEGVARLMEGPRIVAPLTQTPCVWWRYRIERRDTDSRGRARWTTVDSATSDDCFLLEDATGRCIVDPAGAKVIPGQRWRWYGNGPRPAHGPRHGSGWLGALGRNYRYTEELIAPSGALYAIGAFRTQTGQSDAFDEQADLRELLAKWKHDQRMMALLDVNKDGHVDMKEWEAARRMALQRVRGDHVQRAVETPDLHILSKARDGRPFILSAVPQAALVRRFRLVAGSCIAVGLGAGVFALWALSVRGIL